MAQVSISQGNYVAIRFKDIWNLLSPSKDASWQFANRAVPYLCHSKGPYAPLITNPMQQTTPLQKVYTTLMALTTPIPAEHEALIIPNIRTKPKKLVFTAALNPPINSHGAVSLHLAVTLAHAALPV